MTRAWKRTGRLATTLAAAVLALAVAACGGSSSGGDGGGLPGLVFLGNPDAPQGVAIFVDGDNGSDTTGDGSAANPYQTIQKGLQAAGAVPPPAEVYVTAKAGGAAYVERPVVARRAQPLFVPTGVSLFGGYDTGWTRSPGDRTLVEGNTTVLSFDAVDMDAALVGFRLVGSDGLTVALAAASGGSGVLAIDDCDIQAGSSAGALYGSAIGLHAANLAGLRLTNSTVSAGNGADAANGSDITAPGDDGADGVWGGDIGNPVVNFQDWALGGNGGALSGQPAHHKGGRGGDGGRTNRASGDAGKDGGGGAGPAGDGGAGGWLDTSPVIFDVPHAPEDGGNGADGADGARGQGGDGHGDVGGSANTWFPTGGADGATGQAGYGGGGGGGARALKDIVLGDDLEGSGGGGGGSGGAGGRPGSGGSSGGASIGVLLVNVTQALLEGNTLVASDGGNGGHGGTGSAGGAGGTGGGSASRTGYLQGANGGSGGSGGRGGGGGGGGGGPSYAVLLASGDTPVIRNNDILTGAGGVGGASGGTGPTADAASGEGGYSFGVYALDPANPPAMSGNSFVIGTPGVSATASRQGISGDSNF